MGIIAFVYVSTGSKFGVGEAEDIIIIAGAPLIVLHKIAINIVGDKYKKAKKNTYRSTASNQITGMCSVAVGTLTIAENNNKKQPKIGHSVGTLQNPLIAKRVNKCPRFCARPRPLVGGRVRQSR